MTGHMLAIVTPVYNRAAELPHLYQTLCEQTCRDFAWYVVDDGSEDGSWSAVESMAASAPFEVHDMHKENGGKHTAVNLAVRHVKEPLTFIVDSDDWLPARVGRDDSRRLPEYWQRFGSLRHQFPEAHV